MHDTTMIFPQELFDVVITHAAGANDEPSLRTFSLVSRAWCSTARSYLFEKVVLSSISAIPFSELLEGSQQHSTLNGHIRQLSFQGDELDLDDDGELELVEGSDEEEEWIENRQYKPPSFSWAETVQRLGPIYALCPELVTSIHTLQLTEVSFELHDTIQLTGQIFSHIRSLIVYHSMFSDEERDVQHLLSHFTQLQVLKLSAAHDDDLLLAAKPRSPPALRQPPLGLKELYLELNLYRTICAWVLANGIHDGFAGCECHLYLSDPVHVNNVSFFVSLVHAFSSNLLELRIGFVDDRSRDVWQECLTKIDPNPFTNIRHLTLLLVHLYKDKTSSGTKVFIETFVSGMTSLETLRLDVFVGSLDSLKRFGWEGIGDILIPASFPRLRDVTFWLDYPTHDKKGLHPGAAAYIKEVFPELNQRGTLRFVPSG